MAARAKPISGKLYRHFAAITLVATFAVALFSHGEEREAVAAEIDKVAVKAAAEARSITPEGLRPTLPPPPARAAGFYDDPPGTFGAPTMDIANGGYAAAFTPAPAAPPASANPANGVQNGVRINQRPGAAGRKTREQLSADLLAASRRRSGNTGAGD